MAAATRQFQHGRLFKDNYAARVLQAAVRAAHKITPLTKPPADPASIDALAMISDIDVGEAELLALLAEHDGYYLTTGDNRGLVALATEEKVAAIRRRVAGRLICLESVLKLLVNRNGAKATGQAFRALRTHKTISVLLSDPQTRSNDICRQGIDSYLHSLVQKTGSDFLYLP